MRRIYILLAICIMLIAPVSLQAGLVCDAAQLKADIQAQLELLDEDPVGALLEIVSLAASGLVNCKTDSHVFTDREGAQPLLGPLALSEGRYIVTMTTEGSAKVEGVPLEGCGKEIDGTLHNFSSTQAIRGAQNLVEVAGDCKFYLELSRITAPWTLTIHEAPQS